jgi:hypothetical protein
VKNENKALPYIGLILKYGLRNPGKSGNPE